MAKTITDYMGQTFPLPQAQGDGDPGSSAEKLATPVPLLPEDPKERKTYPVWSGVVEYFPAALIETAHVSYVGNIQHNGEGTPLQWARSKSTDQGDTAMRHRMEHAQGIYYDTDGLFHLSKVCWRDLAEFQLFLESRGYPRAPRAR